jgi:hypothetical protein
MVISHLLRQPTAAPQANSAVTIIEPAAEIAQPAAEIAQPAAEIAQPAVGAAELAAIDAALSLMKPSEDYVAPITATATLPSQPLSPGLVATASESASRKALEFAIAGISDGEQEDEAGLIDEVSQE